MATGSRTPRAPIGRRVSGWIARVTERSDRYKTPIGLAILAVGAFLGYTAFQATTGPPFLPKYQLTVKVPSDAPPLRRGQAVRVGGSLAGLIQKVESDPENRQTLVRVNITKTGFRPLPRDTTAFVRVHSIVYATYLGLRPGVSRETLSNGDTLPAKAGSGTDLLEVVQLFDKQARDDLSKTLVNLGFGAAGRGRELNRALGGLPDTSRDLARQLSAATSTPGALAALVEGGARTASGLRGERSDDVGSLIGSADGVFGATANRSGELARAIELLRPFENEVIATSPVAEPALAEIGRTAEALQPVIRNLDAQLPGLVRLAGLGPELRDGFGALLGGGAGGSAGGGGGGSVGTGTGSGGIANQVLIAAKPVISGLFPVQTALKPLNASLQQLLAAVNPYQPEITQAGKWLQSATGVRVPGGTNPGAPTLRAVPILTPRPCLNPQPAPNEAQNDTALGVCK